MAVIQKPALPIIISGTGPAALLLAHALLKASPRVPFHLYERDQSMDYRAQGYRFRVSGRGVKSCRDVLGSEHFALLRATCGDNITKGMNKVNALDGTKLPSPPFKVKSQEEEPLTADRTVMRVALFKGLEKFTTFGKEIVGYETVSSGSSNPEQDINSGVLVRFADGLTVHGSLLVGADGSYSRVRAQLTPQTQLLDTELRMVLGKTFLTPEFQAALDSSGSDGPRAADLLDGLKLLSDPAPREAPMFFMFEPMYFGARDKATSMDPKVAASMPEDYLYWALAFRSDQPEVRDIEWRSIGIEGAASLSEDVTKSWLPALRAILTQQDRTQTVPLVSGATALPLPDWRASDISPGRTNGRNDIESSSPMVTLIGDAAHAMPPTGGLGATTALTDAAVLGAALIKHGITRQALISYETEMREYATAAIQSSIQGGKMFINMRDMTDMKPMHR